MFNRGAMSNISASFFTNFTVHTAATNTGASTSLNVTIDLSGASGGSTQRVVVAGFIDDGGAGLLTSLTATIGGVSASVNFDELGSATVFTAVASVDTTSASVTVALTADKTITYARVTPFTFNTSLSSSADTQSNNSSAAAGSYFVNNVAIRDGGAAMGVFYISGATKTGESWTGVDTPTIANSATRGSFEVYMAYFETTEATTTDDFSWTFSGTRQTGGAFISW